MDDYKTFSDGINENLRDESLNIDSFPSEQDLYTDLVKNFVEMKDYEKVTVQDLTPGKSLQEKIDIYLKEAKVIHFRRRQWLSAILRRYWKDAVELKDNNYQAEKYNKDLLELLQKADTKYYPTRKIEKEKFPQGRDPGYGWTARKLLDNIIKDLHITKDVEQDKYDKAIELINKLQNEKTEVGLTEKERIVLKRHSAATYLKIGGKPFLKEYLNPPKDIEDSIKKIGQELQIPKKDVVDLILRLETPSKEKTLTPGQKQILIKHEAGHYLHYLGKQSLTQYVGFPKEISDVIESLKKDFKKSEDKIIPLINKLKSRETEYELTSKEKEVLRRNAAGRYLKFIGIEPVKGYEGIPADIASSLNQIRTALGIPMRELYKKIDLLQKESSAKKLDEIERDVMKKFNAGKYLDFIGKPVALSYLGLPEGIVKNLIDAQKTLKITNQAAFFKLVDQLRQRSTEQDLTSHHKEIFKRHAVGNYLKYLGKPVVKGYAGLPEDIQSSIKNIRKELQLSKSDTYKLIRKLGSDAKAKELTPIQREVLRKFAAGKYLEYLGEWVVPGFSGFIREKFNPYKMFEGITRTLKITPGEAIDLVYMLKKTALEKRLTTEQKNTLKRYGAGRYLAMMGLPVVPGYTGLPFKKEIDMTTMIKGISHDLGISQQTVFELLDSLGNSEKIRQLRPKTRRILKKWNAGSFRRMLGKKVVKGFGEIFEEADQVPKNIIPRGAFYHPSVGWY